MVKKILITGKSSYVGTQLAEWLNKEPENYKVVMLSVRQNGWKNIDFSPYDVVVHVAGIAHMRETTENEDNYYKVNRDLAYEIAQSAKESGVAHFIFLSTMSVFGKETGVVDEKTLTSPTTHYGKSKLEAEKLISSLADKYFKVAIVRPPMIYGKGCKGNYNRLKKLALNTPIFPNINNQRSMLYIDNFNEFTKSIIDNINTGVFHPQNQEYMNTTTLVKNIANAHGKKIIYTKIFNPLIYFGVKHSKLFSKVFGSLVYDYSFMEKECIVVKSVNNKESIKLTEN